MIGFDSRKRYEKLVSKIKKSNLHAQEASLRISIIKKPFPKIKFNVKIKAAKGYENQMRIYSRNPLKHLIKECDAEARDT